MNIWCHLKVLSANKLGLGVMVVMDRCVSFVNSDHKTTIKLFVCLFEAVRTLQSHFLRQMMPSAQDGRLEPVLRYFMFGAEVTTYFQSLAHKRRKLAYLNCFTWTDKTASGTTMAPDW